MKVSWISLGFWTWRMIQGFFTTFYCFSDDGRLSVILSCTPSTFGSLLVNSFNISTQQSVDFVLAHVDSYGSYLVLCVLSVIIGQVTSWTTSSCHTTSGSLSHSEIQSCRLREYCCPQCSVPVVPLHTGRSVPSFVSDTSAASTQSQSSAIGSDSRPLGSLVTEGKACRKLLEKGIIDLCVCSPQRVVPNHIWLSHRHQGENSTLMKDVSVGIILPHRISTDRMFVSLDTWNVW